MRCAKVCMTQSAPRARRCSTSDAPPCTRHAMRLPRQLPCARCPITAMWISRKMTPCPIIALVRRPCLYCRPVHRCFQPILLNLTRTPWTRRYAKSQAKRRGVTAPGTPYTWTTRIPIRARARTMTHACMRVANASSLTTAMTRMAASQTASTIQTTLYSSRARRRYRGRFRMRLVVLRAKTVDRIGRVYSARNQPARARVLVLCLADCYPRRPRRPPAATLAPTAHRPTRYAPLRPTLPRGNLAATGLVRDTSPSLASPPAPDSGRAAKEWPSPSESTSPSWPNSSDSTLFGRRANAPPPSSWRNARAHPPLPVPAWQWRLCTTPRPNTLRPERAVYRIGGQKRRSPSAFFAWTISGARPALDRSHPPRSGLRQHLRRLYRLWEIHSLPSAHSEHARLSWLQDDATFRISVSNNEIVKLLLM